MICHECKTVFQRPMLHYTVGSPRVHFDRWKAEFEYQETFGNLKEKATLCSCCRGMLRKILESQDGVSAIQPGSKLMISSQITGPNWLLGNRVSFQDKPVGLQAASLQKVLGKDGEEPTSIGSNTGSKETLAFIQDRLNNCLQNHKNCSPRHQGSWYPTRLVEIQDTRVRLIETAETQPSGPFANLSHCWGGAKILQLKQQNLASLKVDIPFGELPKSFQEAISVARSLGMRYLWIDSLCIIQDSNDDWTKEAKTMIKVYQYALFNIAATSSSNSSGGLFRERNPQPLMSNVVDIPHGPVPGRFHLVDGSYFSDQVDQAPLNKRCWVAQERLLSKRIIHFAQEQVIWDCAELTACEGLPHGTDVWYHMMKDSAYVGCKKGSPFLTPPETVENALGQWARVVNTYSACGLTVLSDKIVAISGMADHLREVLGLEYCAGLWRSRIEVQLAWFVEELQPGKPPRNDLAPTWSWASVNGSVRMQDADYGKGYTTMSLISVVDVVMDRHTSKERGERVSGKLHVRCSLNPVEVKGPTERPQVQGRGMQYARRVQVDAPGIIGAERLFVIPTFDVQYKNSLENKWDISSEVRGILLQHVDGSKGTYKRCGHVFFATSVNKETRMFEPEWENLKSAAGKDDVPYDEHGPSGHLITII